MRQTIKGKAFVVGADVDTDQIIPAQHLVYRLDHEQERRFYGRYAFSGVPEAESGLPEGGVPFIPNGGFKSGFRIIVAGKNFGCGSSREHAPAALQIAGARAVVAPTYARIFYRNAVDGGFVVPFESHEDLSKKIRTNDELVIDQRASTLENLTTGDKFSLKPLAEVADIVRAGGIFGYARRNGMVG